MRCYRAGWLVSERASFVMAIVCARRRAGGRCPSRVGAGWLSAVALPPCAVSRDRACYDEKPPRRDSQAGWRYARILLRADGREYRRVG